MQNSQSHQEESPYKQPLEGMLFSSIRLDGTQEQVDFLPGTAMRIWYTHLDTQYPLHWHHAWEIIVGEREHYLSAMEGATYRVDPDDILLIPPGMLHTLEPGRGCNGFVYLLSLDFIHSVRSAARVMPLLSKPIFLTERMNPALHLSAGSLLKQMRDDYFGPNDLRELLVDASLMRFIEQIIHHLFDEEKEDGIKYDKRGMYNAKFNEVLLYLNAHYTEDMTMDEIAQRFGFSKYHFSRLFKQYTRYTFCNYLNYCRMKAAEKLMTESNLSITEISYQAGFTSLATFSRLFHKVKLCTPSEYRKRYRPEHWYFDSEKKNPGNG